MTQKRYAIVRVDNKCPAYENINLCDEENTTCEDCKANDNYGDTKEQLVMKVAQIRFKQATQYGSKDMLKAIYNMCYRQAEEIIKFLGVEG